MSAQIIENTKQKASLVTGVRKRLSRMLAPAKRDDLVVILTATIEVPGTIDIKRTDTQLRHDDYKWALKKWLKNQTSVSKLVFAENSGYPLDELKEIARTHNPYGKQVEFLSFKSHGRQNIDKSYGELMIMRYALDNSTLASDADYIAEVGGRVFIRNFDAIIKRIPERFDVISCWLGNFSNADLNLILMKKSFFDERIFPYLSRFIDVGRTLSYFEREFAKAVHLAIADDYRWFAYPVEPWVQGIGGAKNKSYGRGFWYVVKGTIVTRFFCRQYKMSHGYNRAHILDIWDIKSEARHNSVLKVL